MVVLVDGGHDGDGGDGGDDGNGGKYGGDGDGGGGCGGIHGGGDDQINHCLTELNRKLSKSHI